MRRNAKLLGFVVGFSVGVEQHIFGSSRLTEPVILHVPKGVRYL